MNIEGTDQSVHMHRLVCAIDVPTLILLIYIFYINVIIPLIRVGYGSNYVKIETLRLIQVGVRIKLNNIN